MASIYEIAQRINRQKQSSNSSGNQYFDNAMQVMQMLDQQSKQKSARTIGGMDVFIEGYQNIYDNNVLQDRINTFEKRFGGEKKNRMGVNELDAYENAMLMLSRQKEKNSNFNMYQEKLKDVTKQMDNWMTSADGTEQPDSNAMEQIMLEYMDVRRNFTSSHADRLSSRAFNYINKDMDSIHEMGSFAIASLTDDGIISDGEANAFNKSLSTLDTKFLSEFKKNRDAIALESHNKNVDVMDELLKEYRLQENILSLIQKNELGDEYYTNSKGEQVPVSRTVVRDAMLDIKDKLQNRNKSYIQSKFNVEKQSYLEELGLDSSASDGDTDGRITADFDEKIVDGNDSKTIVPKTTVDKKIPKANISNIVPKKTNVDEKRYSVKDLDNLPKIRKANGKFVFVDNNNIVEWDNVAYIPEIDKIVPILKGKSDFNNKFWDGSKWKDLSRLLGYKTIQSMKDMVSTKIMTKKEYEKEVKESKELSSLQKKAFLKDFGKGLNWLKSKVLKLRAIPSEGKVISVDYEEK